MQISAVAARCPHPLNLIIACRDLDRGHSQFRVKLRTSGERQEVIAEEKRLEWNVVGACDELPRIRIGAFWQPLVPGIERGDAKGARRSPPESLQVFSAERPTARGYPVAALKVGSAQWNAVAAPPGRGSEDPGAARCAEIVLVSLDNRSGRVPPQQLLGEIIRLQVAAFDDDNAYSRPHELSCERDAGRPAADDAHICFQRAFCHASYLRR